MRCTGYEIEQIVEMLLLCCCRWILQDVVDQGRSKIVVNKACEDSLGQGIFLKLETAIS